MAAQRWSDRAPPRKQHGAVAPRAAGVEAQLEVYEGQSHAQYLFDDRLPKPQLLLVRSLNSSPSISASKRPARGLSDGDRAAATDSFNFRRRPNAGAGMKRPKGRETPAGIFSVIQKEVELLEAV